MGYYRGVSIKTVGEEEVWRHQEPLQTLAHWTLPHTFLPYENSHYLIKRFTYLESHRSFFPSCDYLHSIIFEIFVQNQQHSKKKILTPC